jgi:hypothetical protein
MAERRAVLADAVLRFLRRIAQPEQVPELRSGHAALELGLCEHGADEAVLIEQHVLVEADVGDAERALVAQLTVVAEDRDLVERMFRGHVEAPVPVVVAHRVRRAHEHEPTRVEQRIEPREVLSRHRHRARDGDRHRDSLPDRFVEEDPAAPDADTRRRTRPRNARAIIQSFDFGHGTMDEWRSRRDARAGAARVAILPCGHVAGVYGAGHPERDG